MHRVASIPSRPGLPIALLVCVAAVACGSGAPTSSEQPAGPGSDAGADGAKITTGGPDAGGLDSSPSSSSDSGSFGDSAPSGDSGASFDSGHDAAGGPVPAIPTPTGTCPTFANGDVTFSPAGIPARHATVYMTDAAATLHGPLIVYWYATGSSTQEAAYSLGATLATIEAAGGIVVAPDADPTAGEFEWFIVNGSPKLDDFQVADEIVGCAAKTTGIDTTHIHSMGMSAGALQTTAVSFMRSAYIASVATYSGGMPPGFMPTTENPANKFAALIFDGGSTDDVFGVDFQAASQLYLTTLQAAGHFAAICDHGMGHSIPLDAAPSVAMFFQANGFGVSPSPYANGLPASFPSYCML
jgi:poly(3-hydroxybutyrate) depolymerase